MAKEFEIEGLDKAIQKVRSLVSALEAKNVENVLKNGAQIIADKAEDNAPVDEGVLKSAIKAKKGKRRGNAVTSAFAAVDRKKAPHGWLVEHGTSRMAAQPYFRPAVNETLDEVKRTVEDGIRKLLEGAK